MKMLEKTVSDTVSDTAYWAVSEYRGYKSVQEIAEIAESCVGDEVYGKTFSEEEAKKAGDMAFELVFEIHPDW